MEYWPLIGGIFLGWALGSNDAANIFGTGVATNLIKFRTAMILIAVFVIMGAVLEGSKVIMTVGTLSQLTARSAFFSTLAAGILVAFMSKLGIPVSTSHAIIGAIFGVGLITHSAKYSIFAKVVLCWIFTPIGAALLSIFLHLFLSRIFGSKLMSFRMRDGILRAGIVLAGGYGAYALGSNNVGNVTGVYVGAGLLSPLSAALIGSLSIAFGAVTYSKNVIYTVGKQIFPLEDYSAFVAVIAEAATVHLFTQLGVPVSASQAVVGAVLGIGFLKNMHAIKIRQIWLILAGWILTPLGTALLTFLLLAIFHNTP